MNQSLWLIHQLKFFDSYHLYYTSNWMVFRCVMLPITPKRLILNSSLPLSCLSSFVTCWVVLFYDFDLHLIWIRIYVANELLSGLVMFQVSLSYKLVHACKWCVCTYYLNWCFRSLDGIDTWWSSKTGGVKPSSNKEVWNGVSSWLSQSLRWLLWGRWIPFYFWNYQPDASIYRNQRSSAEN